MVSFRSNNNNKNNRAHGNLILHHPSQQQQQRSRKRSRVAVKCGFFAAVFFVGVVALLWSSNQQKQYYQQQFIVDVENDDTDNRKESLLSTTSSTTTHATATQLLKAGKATVVNITLVDDDRENKKPSSRTQQDPYFSFQLLCYPPTIDKIITVGLMKIPITYEQDVTKFLRYVFPTTAPTSTDSSTTTTKTRTTTSTSPTTTTTWWIAVDLGANVGYHTMTMAYLGSRIVPSSDENIKVHVIALEPAKDTFDLLHATVHDLNHHYLSTKTLSTSSTSSTSQITLINAGASEKYSTIKLDTLHRHADSPGMTTLVNTQNLPYKLEQIMTAEDNSNGKETGRSMQDGHTDKSSSSNTIRLIPVQDTLEEVIHQRTMKNKDDNENIDSIKLRLLKVDVEGYEYYALRGINLDKYPFEYILVEYFPQLIEASGIVRPLDVLEYIISRNYDCIEGWKTTTSNSSNGGDGFSDRSGSTSIGHDRSTLEEWSTKHMKRKSHANIFCKKINQDEMGATTTTA